jgi:hypothetical protein
MTLRMPATEVVFGQLATMRVIPASCSTIARLQRHWHGRQPEHAACPGIQGDDRARRGVLSELPGHRRTCQELGGNADGQGQPQLRSQRLRMVNHQGDALRLGMNWTEEDLAKPQVLVDSAYGMGRRGRASADPDAARLGGDHLGYVRSPLAGQGLEVRRFCGLCAVRRDAPRRPAVRTTTRRSTARRWRGASAH